MERPFALKRRDICREETHRRTMECIDVTAKGTSKIFHLCDKCDSKLSQYRTNADMKFLADNKTKAGRNK